MSYRVIFAGTPDFSVPSLKSLIADSRFDVVAVFTQPDRPKGRGQKLAASPVKEVALQHNITVYQPQNLKDIDTQNIIKNLNADVMIVVAYGLLLPEIVLSLPKMGCINIHGSILPAWRGAAPIQRSLEAGDTETGVCIMQMEKGLDTGPVFSVKKLPILDTDTSATLFEKLANLGAETLIEVLPNILNQTLLVHAQDHNKATYAKKLSKDEAELNWQENASTLERRIRAFYPWPGSYIKRHDQIIKIGKTSILPNIHQTPGKIIEVTQRGIVIACGEGALCITEVQLPGSKMQPVTQLIQSPSFIQLFYDK